MRIHSRDGRREPPQYIWRLCQITGASIPGGKYRQAANGCALVRVVVCLSCPTPLCNTGPAVRGDDRPCPSETLCRAHRILTLCVAAAIMVFHPSSTPSLHFVHSLFLRRWRLPLRSSSLACISTFFPILSTHLSSLSPLVVRVSPQLCKRRWRAPTMATS